MSGDENLNRYQFHRDTSYGAGETTYHAYKGFEKVGELSVMHRHDWDTDEEPTLGSNVSYLMTAKGHRHLAPTLIGIAQVDAIAAGTSLTPSEDLSPHSSRLVRKMKSRGLVTQSAEDEPSNNIDLRTARYAHPEDRQGRRLSTGHVQGGRNLMRRALKYGTPY